MQMATIGDHAEPTSTLAPLRQVPLQAYTKKINEIRLTTSKIIIFIRVVPILTPNHLTDDCLLLCGTPGIAILAP